MAENAIQTEQEVQSRIEAYLEAEDGEVTEQDELPERAEPEQPETEQPEAKPQEEVTDEETVQVSSLRELAENIGVEIADLYKITVPVTVGSETKEIPIGEWKDSYQAAEQNKADREAFAQAKQAFEQEAKQQKQALYYSLQEAGELVSSVEKQLLADMEGINWNELRGTDPAEYAALRSDYNSRLKAIQDQKQEIRSKAEQAFQEQQQEMQTQWQQHIAAEAAKLPQRIPEWSDPKIADAEKAEVAKYLLSKGFTAQEVNNAADSRSIEIARNAMLYEKTKRAQPDIKKVIKIGKNVLKPGSPQSKAEQAQDDYQSDYQKAMKSGNDRQIAAFYEKYHYLGDK